MPPVSRPLCSHSSPIPTLVNRSSPPHVPGESCHGPGDLCTTEALDALLSHPSPIALVDQNTDGRVLATAYCLASSAVTRVLPGRVQTNEHGGEGDSPA